MRTKFCLLPIHDLFTLTLTPTSVTSGWVELAQPDLDARYLIHVGFFQRLWSYDLRPCGAIIIIIILARTKTCFVRCGRLYMSPIKCLSYVVVCPMVHWAHVRVYHSTILSDDISTESAIVAGSWSWLTNTNHAITPVAIAHVLIITENYVLRPNCASRCIPVQLLPSYSHIVE